MRKLPTISLLSLVTAISCIPIGDYDKETGEDFDTFDTEEQEETLPLEMSVSWGDSSISIDLTNGDADAMYYWGLAENSGDCLTADYGCWTGEDCFMGFDLTSGGNYTYCHPVNTNGGMLAYGASPDGVVEGSTTVFSSPNFSIDVTHILDNAASIEEETCWVWGADTNYYNGYDKTCIEM